MFFTICGGNHTASASGTDKTDTEYPPKANKINRSVRELELHNSSYSSTLYILLIKRGPAGSEMPSIDAISGAKDVHQFIIVTVMIEAI